jgi:long-chain fatty acid transport protein
MAYTLPASRPLRRVSRSCAALACAALAAWLATSPAPCAANPFDLYGAGARAAAMSGAMSTLADDATSIYYNLATMAYQESSFAIGFVTGVDRVNIRLKSRPSGFDLPDLGPNSGAIPSSYRLRERGDTNDILDTYGIYLGAVGSLGFKFLRVGILVYLPVNHVGLQQTRFPDEREQYFSNRLDFDLIGARQQQQVVMMGLAYQLTTWLSFGAGLSFLPSNDSFTHIYLDNPTDQSNIDLTLNNEQAGRIAALVGLLFSPLDYLRVSFAYRGENYFSFSTVNEIQIRGFQENRDAFPVEQHVQAALNYTPHQFVTGAAFVRDGLSVSADLEYALWSQYLNHQNLRDTGFHDTISVRVGSEYIYSPSLRFRAGFGFIQSPVPDQVGRTNYVDNHRLQLSLGLGHPFRLFDLPFELSWSLQVHHLISRDTNKQAATAASCTPNETLLCDELPDDALDPATNQTIPGYQGLQTGNPGFPGFQSFGQLISAGFDLRWSF